MNLTRRHFLQSAGAASALVISGCDFWQRPAWVPPARVERSRLLAPPGAVVDNISHVLARLSFGATPWEYARVQALGVEAYIEEQLNPAYLEDAACDYALRRLETLRVPARELFEYQDALLLEECSRATLLRAVYSERQLFEVMVEFWTDHFNIAWSKGDCRWLKPGDDRDVIRKHAMGTFPDLLRATATSPAMLWYLDGRLNTRAYMGERPNENYARELLELHALGVRGGYSQRDVAETARCFTGWQVRQEEWFGRGTVSFVPELHDDGEKQVLGSTIPAGLGAEDVDAVLGIVTRHPATARHLAERLCSRFIADTPPSEAVEQVAAAYTASQGDIRSMLRVLFGTTAFWESAGAKLKRPLHFLASALRATAAQTDVSEPLLDYLLRMGHAPFQYPTPDGYPLDAAPWLGTLLWRWHFALALARGQVPGVFVDWRELEDASGGAENFHAHLLGRRATAAETSIFGEYPNGAALVLASPGFQRC